MTKYIWAKILTRRQPGDFMSAEYLHGFSEKEQKRLLHQAKFLENFVYSGLELPKKGTLLEVGCGVGAQTKIILKRCPQLKIDSVDLSSEQLSLAKKILKSEISKKRVRLFQADATQMSLDRKNYEGAFICWFLEHVPDPLMVLKGVRKLLKPGARVFCSEVFNQTLFLEPYAPAVLKYWFHFNDLQWSIKGHPFVGAQLGHYLSEAGFKKIQVEPIHLHFDSRNKRSRALFADYFLDILLSAQDKLLSEGRVTQEDVERVKLEFSLMKSSPTGVFYYSFVRGIGSA
jgi:ubiquinone/menaquinone biosynthesis C-methylase UbiE